jgi:hypothetical protein
MRTNAIGYQSYTGDLEIVSQKFEFICGFLDSSASSHIRGCVALTEQLEDRIPFTHCLQYS